MTNLARELVRVFSVVGNRDLSVMQFGVGVGAPAELATVRHSAPRWSCTGCFGIEDCGRRQFSIAVENGFRILKNCSVTCGK